MAEHITEILALFGAVTTMLIAVLAWIGNRVHQRLDTLTTTVDTKFEQIHAVLSSIERDLRGDLVDLDRRIARLESRCELMHREV